ncbi:LOW QUALITY PROTEIN: phosphoenolpyruvate carboxykinase [GTP], mitochondrial-like [Aythya fuligula]|uniref:phosphoenolpyruvate carboxykinase (GTP) n=1 Tax=Aythya fuligula TaxID=219594 RepID=A0A6J3DJ38_AYTFU|nr:LOW QUALITY PROTEIN: phosphoenolpyruvate carboxykinase [GTP], mitochondrial-like [Aythya fuligula]
MPTSSGNKLGFSPQGLPLLFERAVFTLAWAESLLLAGAARGALAARPPPARDFVEEGARLCRPRALRLCDGSEEEGRELLRGLQEDGTLLPLPKYENCWLARMDPRDMARVESHTVLVTERERDAVPPRPQNRTPQLGNWMSPQQLEQALQQRFPSCMEGRTMYIIPFSVGPPLLPLAKAGVQLTDSPYVVASMRIMTRVGHQIFPLLATGDFVRCLHSVGWPLPLRGEPVNGWPCDPKRTLVTHVPTERRIASFGSGYGGNLLLGKKCFALRIASRMARDEGWLAEHMLLGGSFLGSSLVIIVKKGKLWVLENIR